MAMNDTNCLMMSQQLLKAVGKSKLVEVFTVVDVDEEDRVGNSLLLIWELRFGHKAIFFRYCQLSTYKS